MKNIHEILKAFGIEIPEEKKEAFDKAVLENYKTVKELEGVREKLETAEKEKQEISDKYSTDLQQRDNDLEALRTQLEDAGQSKEKLAQLQKNLTEAQEKYATDKAAWEKQLSDQQYSFSINEKARDLEFTSKAARKVFMDELLANPLQMKDGDVLGFNDYVDAYRESNPDSFVTKDEPDEEGGNPHFSSSTSGIKKEEAEEQDNKQAELPVIW